MRLRSVITAASLVLVLGAVGCSKTDSPKEVDASSATTVDDSATGEAAPGCPTQLVVDSVNEEFDNMASGADADVEGAMETMGQYIPSDLQEDFETWQTAALDVVDLIDGIDPTLEESELTESEAADLAEAQEIMTDAGVDAAQSNVKDYFRDACPDIVWSEDSASTSSTETSDVASSGGCPTQTEIDELTTSFDDLTILTGDEFATHVISAINALDAYMPPEYDSDLDLMRQTYEAFGSSVEGIDLNDPNLSPEQQTQIENAGEALDSPEIAAAQESFEEYFTTNCPELDFTG